MDHNGTDPLTARDREFASLRDVPLTDTDLDTALASLADEEIPIPDEVRERMLRVIRGA